MTIELREELEEDEESYSDREEARLKNLWSSPLAGESAEKFKWFEIYRDLTVHLKPRSVLNAIREFHGIPLNDPIPDNKEFRDLAKKLKLSRAKFQWRERARLFDDHNYREKERLRQEALVQEIELWADRKKKIKEKEFATAERLLSKIDEMLQFPLEQIQTQRYDRETRTYITHLPVKWTLADAAKFLEVYSKISRMATDEVMAGDTPQQVDEETAYQKVVERIDRLSSTRPEQTT